MTDHKATTFLRVYLKMVFKKDFFVESSLMILQILFLNILHALFLTTPYQLKVFKKALE